MARGRLPLQLLRRAPAHARRFGTQRDDESSRTGAEKDAREGAQKDAVADAATDTANDDILSHKAIVDEASNSSQSQSSGSGETSEIKDWEANPNWKIESFKDLPHANFGVNQHIPFDPEFKDVLKQIPWQFRAPIRYAFAYGSGVFPQSKANGKTASAEIIRSIHPIAPPAVQRAQDGTPKMIDFIFGVSHTQHWHSLNMKQHHDHYSSLASLGSGAVSYVQDKWGAGVYFNPYVVVNGILIKYGVVQLSTLEQDLTQWDTLYLAGRLQKPVKILRDDPKIRLANQMNLLSALRTALLLLPPNFTEEELYGTIAGISYLGDPRMALPTENPSKVKNIVGNNMANFRRLYLPLIETLPNVEFNDPAASDKDWIRGEASLKLVQDMDPVKRGNMVRRLPKSFRSRLYFQYQKKFAIPQVDFDKMMSESKNEDAISFKRREGGGFEQRIAQDDTAELRRYIRTVIKQTIGWPATTQSLKGPLTSGFRRTWRYMSEKIGKYWEGRAAEKAEKAAKDEEVASASGTGKSGEEKR
ncbi:mitochondrial matrix Mmp37-domain-containing protein [Lasiosphaeria miniovina]|uniref:Phosphatidate cytidylyltransferase, mitochondrial n=1 Tax=Lasiosphaeria miniovina TaxID=1954250 RepID=A0AA40DGD0_9PEZI|nr:mitochondrial matrix Mmp37-domain-containing protein [Lasiosphaeria miniovina]KAK0702080.1 mitochondrial matrix Mmp37-domain-containing protein [Lasiosphaeria miniovina]